MGGFVFELAFDRRRGVDQLGFAPRGDVVFYMLLDWDKMIAEATSQDDIDERIYKTLPDEWLKGYTFSQLYCPDGGIVHYRLTPSMVQDQERMLARIAELHGK